MLTDGRTDIRTHGHTDIRTDRPSYRDARTHLKTKQDHSDNLWLNNNYNEYNHSCFHSGGKIEVAWCFMPLFVILSSFPPLHSGVNGIDGTSVALPLGTCQNCHLLMVMVTRYLVK